MLNQKKPNICIKKNFSSSNDKNFPITIKNYCLRLKIEIFILKIYSLKY